MVYDIDSEQVLDQERRRYRSSKSWVGSALLVRFDFTCSNSCPLLTRVAIQIAAPLRPTSAFSVLLLAHVPRCCFPVTFAIASESKLW